MRHTHKITKHLYLRRAGLHELSFPSTTTSVDEYSSSAATFARYQATKILEVGRDAWKEPQHGVAVRVPPLKQAKTARGHTFYSDTVVYHESELEQRVSTLLKTYRGLKRLISQYPKVEWVDAEGMVHNHTCDYFIEFENGARIAIVVKYARKRSEMLDLIERICANNIAGVATGGKVTQHVADAVALVTNHEATHEAFENAYFLLSSREHHDEKECLSLQEIVEKLPGCFRFGELLLNCWSRAKRRTAVWRLLDRGLLKPVTPGRIDELSLLTAV